MRQLETVERGELFSADELTICQAVPGLFVLSRPAPDELLASADYVSIDHFGEVAEAAAVSDRRARGTMSVVASRLILDIPLTTPALPESHGYVRYRGRKNDLLLTVQELLNASGSGAQEMQKQVLLGRQLVHDVWAQSVGSEVLHSPFVPRIGPVAQRVVAEVVERMAQESDPKQGRF